MNWPYQTLGDSNAPPLCFLHGFLGRGSDWLQIAAKFSETNFCLLPDLPGHGENILHSTGASCQTLTFDLINDSLLVLLDSLALPKIHLIGYSMGGRAALYFAVHHSERVASLTLESASPGITDPNERHLRAGEDERRAEAILSGGVEAFVEHWYTLPLFRSLATYPNVQAQIIAQRKLNNPAGVAQAIRDLSPGRQPAVWDQLSRLEMPVLLVVGALDEKYVAIGQQMAVHFPNSQLKIIPKTGHTVHLEQPEKFVSLLQDFFSLVQ
ncbi:MAG: 2-succinyl-6-hydroxy-2,4-cyclohexadiene-1-carboxy late synthase [Anaerolineales bacterium]